MLNSRHVTRSLSVVVPVTECWYVTKLRCTKLITACTFLHLHLIQGAHSPGKTGKVSEFQNGRRK